MTVYSMTSIKLSDFDKICRTCLFKKPNMSTIHKAELIDMFHSFTEIKISQNDGLPYLICTDCTAQIHRAYDFKAQCEHSDLVLRRLLNSKEENESIKCYLSDSIKIEVDEYSTRCKSVRYSNVPKTEIDSNAMSNDSFADDKNCEEYRNLQYDRISSNVAHDENEDEWVDDKEEWSSEDEISIMEAFKLKKGDVESSFRSELKDEKEPTNRLRIKKIMSMGPDKCDPTNLTCKICNKVLVNIYSLARHMEMHDEDRKFNFTCSLCLKGFYEKGQLTKHMRRHKGETRYKCERCSKGYYELSALSVHMKTHHKAVPLSCEVCKKSFYVQKQLDIHLKTHSTKKEHNCNKCGKTFNLPCQLKRHELVHKKESSYPCLFCDKIFKYSFNLKKHHECFHVDGNEIKLEVCNVCGKSVKNIKPHMLTHATNATFECSQCPRAFKDQYRLNYHRKIKHSLDNGGRQPFPYLCATCGKRCASTTKLRVHTRVHTGERPFACNLCDKRFITNAQRCAHVRIHTGERPYVCGVCTRGFHIRNLLTRHMLTHTGEKPHKCDVCSRAFAQRSSLKTHMKVH